MDSISSAFRLIELFSSWLKLVLYSPMSELVLNRGLGLLWSFFLTQGNLPVRKLLQLFVMVDQPLLFPCGIPLQICGRAPKNHLSYLQFGATQTLLTFSFLFQFVDVVKLCILLCDEWYLWTTSSQVYSKLQMLLWPTRHQGVWLRWHLINSVRLWVTEWRMVYEWLSDGWFVGSLSARSCKIKGSTRLWNHSCFFEM